MDFHYPEGSDDHVQRYRNKTPETPTGPPESWTVRRPKPVEQKTEPAALEIPIVDVENVMGKLVHRGMQVLLVLVTVVGLLLLARIFLIALNAAPTAPFVQFVYDHTGGLVAPFHSMFSNGDVGGHPIEVNAIVAIMVYGIGMAVVVKFIELMLSPNRRRRKLTPVD